MPKTKPAPKTIKIACSTKDVIPLDDLKPLQGDLKDISDEDLGKLCAEITTTGFAMPVLAWRDKKGKHWIVGGHQRVKALWKLAEDGYEVPAVPIVLVEAKDRKEACRRVLQDVAQYGRVTAEGVRGFSEMASIDLEAIRSSFRMPDLDLDALTRAVENRPPRKVEFTVGEGKEPDDKKEGKHECPRCGHQF